MKGLTSWLLFVIFIVFCYFPMRYMYPGSGKVLDRIIFWSLPSFLLYRVNCNHDVRQSQSCSRPWSNLTVKVENINPFKPNGISHRYQLDQSISALSNIGWYFQFYSNFNITFCKQTVDSLGLVWCLVWVCTICLRPAKSTLDLYGLEMTEKSTIWKVWFWYFFMLFCFV